MLDEKLLSVLACPKCKGQLEYKQKPERLVCQDCRLDFEIKEDIPILLLEGARKF
jgi:uncharacterized protein YbaR (Trm112 family)